MATNLFSKAAAYRRKHPNLTQAEAVKAVAKANRATKKAAPKKRAVAKKAAPKKRAVGKVKRRPAQPKKAAPAAPRKIKVKIKPGKKGTSSISISGIAMTKIHHEHSHQAQLESALKRHQAALKTPGHTLSEKTKIRREIVHTRAAIAASKKHISALKRSI